MTDEAVAGQLAQRRVEPVVVVRRDDQPHVAHAERFGERVDDERLAQFHRRVRIQD